MRRWNRSARIDPLDEEGSAALEFIVAGVLLLVPLIYLVLTLGAVQEQTLGAEAAARHTARVIGQAESAEAASAGGDAVLASVMREYGMDPDTVGVGITCAPAAAACPSAGATVIVTVRTKVSLPFMPPIFGLDELAAIPVEAQSAQKVSRLWGSG
ncbi:TadE family protein [Microbacterium sp. NPDC058345]|uniref:TadE family protein n=1 Tax=Microbacterium sp. NPDC058345 TaxID=3346455 RepID=UPI003653854D